MSTREITDQILGAWDEISEPETPATEEPETEPAEEETAGEEEESPAEEEETEGDEEEAEDEPEETDGEEDEEKPEEEPVTAAFETDDPEARAFLSKYQGDVERALKGGLQTQQALSREHREKEALAERVAELEAEAAQSEPFIGGPHFLTGEQREWVGAAMESGNPTPFIRAAVEAGEFGLARALCSEWGSEAPYEALRVSQAVDAAEYAQAQRQQAPVDLGPIDRKAMVEALLPHFPDLPSYAEQMTHTIARLGESHPLVVESRSDDPETAMRGIVNIYEIARASSAALAETRESARNGHRVQADAKRKKAVVSSSGATPSPSESARPVALGPGLTLEALDQEWERSK